MTSKWKLSSIDNSNIDGYNLIYNIILSEINNNNNKILLNDLSKNLLEKTKNINIYKNNKKKTINNFINDKYGSLISLIDIISDFGILYTNKKTYAIIINKYICNNHEDDNNIEWIMV